MPFNTSDPEINMLHHTMHWLINHWQFTLFVIGSMLGGILWWMQQAFASKKHVEECRINMVESYDRKLERYHTENREEHRELRRDVKSILGHLLDKD